MGIVEDEPEVRRRFEDAVRAHPRLSWQFSAATVAEAIACTQQRPADVYLVDQKASMVDQVKSGMGGD